MAGYYDYSMSNNAVNAYNSGIKPLSKFKAADFKNLGITKAFAMFLAKSGTWRVSEWHHTSSWYSETNFYCLVELEEALEELKESGEIKNIQTEFESLKNKEKDAGVPVEGVYIEWGGSRNYPKKIGEVKFTGQLIGQWIHLENGKRKKADSNWVSYKKAEGTTDER